MADTIAGSYFVDPLDHLHIKILSTIACILMLPGCCIAFCFIWYEVSGNAGPYRTCTNQLVSVLYFMISFYFTVITNVDLIRAWYGPLPESVCIPLQLTRHTIHMMTSILWTVVALLKVWIVCIHKSVPNMDDDFIATFVTRASLMMSFLFSIVGMILPQKPALAHWMCIGQYGQEEHELKRTFPIPAILIGFGLLSNIISAIMVYIQRRKLERLETMTITSLGLSKNYPNRIPRSLESLIGNCITAVLILACAISSFTIKVPLEDMDQPPFIYFIFNHFFGMPLILSIFMGCVILNQHGRALKRALL